MLQNTAKECELNPYVPVTSHAPPMFLLHAEDDTIDTVRNSLLYYAALKKAGVPVEMHLYPQGGHAFGLRRTKFPITTDWPRLVENVAEGDQNDSGLELDETSSLRVGGANAAGRQASANGSGLSSGDFAADVFGRS